MALSSISKASGAVAGIAIAAMMSVAGLSPAAAQDVQLVYSNGFPKGHVQPGVVADEWIRRLEEATEGRLRMRHVAGGALLTAEATLDGVRRGIADCGALVTAYNPGALPITATLMGAIDLELGSMLDVNGLTAINTQLYREFEEFRDEYKKMGVRAVLWVPTTPYAVLSSKPTRTLADMEGQRLRGFGEVVPKFEAAMGAVPVSVAFGEMYTSIQTRLLDGVMTDLPAMVSMKLSEVAKNLLLTGPGMGTSLIGASVVYICNEDSLARLSAADLEKVAAVEADMFGYIAETMEQTAGRALETLKEAGVEINNLSPEDLATLKEKFSPFDEAARALDARGLPGTAIAARYRELASDYLSGKWQP